MKYAHTAIKTIATATAIAQTAKRLGDLREAWLNPPEWTDYTPDMPDEEILKRLQALNLARCK